MAHQLPDYWAHHMVGRWGHPWAHSQEQCSACVCLLDDRLGRAAQVMLEGAPVVPLVGQGRSLHGVPEPTRYILRLMMERLCRHCASRCLTIVPLTLHGCRCPCKLDPGGHSSLSVHAQEDTIQFVQVCVSAGQVHPTPALASSRVCSCYVLWGNMRHLSLASPSLHM
jgi:hypothetical protein